jgi:hypothetical protein
VSERESEPQVSWMVVERDAAVVTADGREVARVVEVAGDFDLDIFSGLVVRSGARGTKRLLPADRVVAIWRRRVEVDLTGTEIESLPPYEPPVVERITPEEGGLLERLRRRLGG